MANFLDCVISLWKTKGIPIDNFIFRLHYRVTFLSLVFFSLLLAIGSLFRDPISCSLEYINEVFKYQCYFQSMFVEDVKNFITEDYHSDKESQKRSVAYCAKVIFVLFFQAFIFYLPHILWKCKEGGKQESVLLRQTCSRRVSSSEKGLLSKIPGYEKINMINKFYHKLGWYAYWYYFCEILNFMNVIIQIFFVNRFLGGKFLDYGPRVFNFIFSSNSNVTELIDPTQDVFPLMVKCSFHKYGASGILIRYDTLCALKLNTFISWLYVILWFWFIILAILSAMVICYRFLLIFPLVRFWIILWYNPKINPDKLDAILSIANLGDWFILNRLCKNIDEVEFGKLIDSLYKEMNYSSLDSPTKDISPTQEVNYVFVNSRVNHLTSNLNVSKSLSTSDSDLHRRIK